MIRVICILLISISPLLADAPSMRIATYNGYDPVLGSTRASGQQRLVAEIAPDVLCAQEFNGLADDLFVDVPVTIEANRSATVAGIHITSVHLSVSGGNHYTTMQAFIAAVPDGPAIIAGDFNETPDGRDTYGVAFDLLAMHALTEAGWQRVDTPVQPESGLPLASPGASLTHGCGRLDQIWVTPDIEILACGIPPSPWVRDGQYLSDHAPVWADVTIPEPPVVVLLLAGLLHLVQRR